MEKIILIKINSNLQRVFFVAMGDVVDESNGVELGEFIRDVDGFFYFKHMDSDGLWSEYSLRLLANKLKEVNKDWEEQIQKEFDKDVEM